MEISTDSVNNSIGSSIVFAIIKLKNGPELYGECETNTGCGSLFMDTARYSNEVLDGLFLWISDGNGLLDLFHELGFSFDGLHSLSDEAIQSIDNISKVEEIIISEKVLAGPERGYIYSVGTACSQGFYSDGADVKSVVEENEPIVAEAEPFVFPNELIVNEVSNEIPDDTVEKAVDEFPIEAIEDATDEIPIETVEEATDEIPIETVEEATDEIPIETVEDVIDEVSEDIIDKIVDEEVSADLSDDTADEVFIEEVEEAVEELSAVTDEIAEEASAVTDEIAEETSGNINDAFESNWEDHMEIWSQNHLPEITSTEETLSIPSNIETISFSCLAQNPHVKTIILPEGMKAVPRNAFMNSLALENVQLSSTIESIDVNAFAGCKSLKKINLPEGLTTIGNCAFEGAENLENLVFPGSLRKIGRAAFRNCKKIQSVDLPQNLEALGGYAFAGCDDLRVVTTGNNLDAFNMSSISACRNLMDVFVPSPFTEIKGDTFTAANPDLRFHIAQGSMAEKDMMSIENIFVDNETPENYSVRNPRDVAEISDPYEFLKTHSNFNNYSGRSKRIITSGRNGSIDFKLRFAGNPWAESICITDDVTESLFGRCFDGCRSLKQVTLPKSASNYSSHFDMPDFCDCPCLENIVISRGYTSISGFALEGSTSLKNVFLPNTITDVDKYWMTRNESGYYSSDILFHLEEGSTIGPELEKRGLEFNYISSNDYDRVLAHQSDTALIQQIAKEKY